MDEVVVVGRGAAQPDALAIYRHLEEWWGESISDALVDRISQSPREHVLAYQEARPDLGFTVSQLAPGELRPWFNHWNSRRFPASVGLRLLLWVPGVVLPWHLLCPDIGRNRPEDLLAEYRWLAAVKPLVEQGRIWFNRYESSEGLTWPEWLEIGRGVENDDLLASLYGEDFLPSKDSWDREMLRDGLELRSAKLLREGMSLIQNGRATPGAATVYDASVTRFLYGGPRSLDRQDQWSRTLAGLPVPDFYGSPRDIVSLLLNGDAFATFRCALELSLMTLQDEPADFGERKAAASQVGAHLARGLAPVRAEVERSPTLESLKSGARSLGFAALGLGAGTATSAALGAPLTGAAAGLASAAALKTVEAVRDRQKRARDHRNAESIWRVATSFTRSAGS